jgi:hypothetical protein
MSINETVESLWRNNMRFFKYLAVFMVGCTQMSCGAESGHAARQDQSLNARFDEALKLLGQPLSAAETTHDPATSERLKQLSSHGRQAHLALIDNGLTVALTDHVAISGPEAYLAYPPVLIVVNNVEIVPIHGTYEMWEQVRSKLLAKGGQYFERYRRDVTKMLQELEGARLSIQTYQIGYGRDPDFSKQWDDLIKTESLIHGIPRNRLADESVLSKIVIVDSATHEPSSISLNEAAWVWNSATKTLHCAGWSQAQLDAVIKQPPDPPPFADWRRRNATMDPLGGFRCIIAGFVIENGPPGQGRNPTLDELISHHFIQANSLRMVNPFNGSSLIQQAKWDPDQPPVSGNAGWNYDPDAGKIWANSRIMNENTW